MGHDWIRKLLGGLRPLICPHPEPGEAKERTPVQIGKTDRPCGRLEPRLRSPEVKLCMMLRSQGYLSKTSPIESQPTSPQRYWQSVGNVLDSDLGWQVCAGWNDREGWCRGLVKTIAVLVVGCPCAISLGMPTVAVSVTARNEELFKVHSAKFFAFCDLT